MSISREEALRAADLAHLILDDAEADAVTRDLNRVLELVGRLDAPEPEGAEAGEGAAAEGTPLREDEETPGLAPGEAITTAPEAEGDLFRVPPVLGGD